MHSVDFGVLVIAKQNKDKIDTSFMWSMFVSVYLGWSFDMWLDELHQNENTYTTLFIVV